MPAKLNNKLLKQIIEEATPKLAALVAEKEKELIKDFNDACDAAQDDGADKLPKLKLAYKIDYDLATSTIDLTLGWTVQRKITESITLDHPDQQKMDFAG